MGSDNSIIDNSNSLVSVIGNRYTRYWNSWYSRGDPVDYIQLKKEKAIDNFYESGTYNNSHLSIYEKDGAIYEYYSLIESVDYDTLKELAKDKEVSITFFSNNGNLYTMNKDGKIVSEDSYEYKSAIYYND